MRQIKVAGMVNNDEYDHDYDYHEYEDDDDDDDDDDEILCSNCVPNYLIDDN